MRNWFKLGPKTRADERIAAWIVQLAMYSGKMEHSGCTGVESDAPLHTLMATNTLLGYYKDILDRISFADGQTFSKELRKAFRQLLPEERTELKRWFRTQCVCRMDQQEMKALLIAMERYDRR